MGTTCQELAARGFAHLEPPPCLPRAGRFTAFACTGLRTPVGDAGGAFHAVGVPSRLKLVWLNACMRRKDSELSCRRGVGRAAAVSFGGAASELLDRTVALPRRRAWEDSVAGLGGVVADCDLRRLREAPPSEGSSAEALAWCFAKEGGGGRLALSGEYASDAIACPKGCVDGARWAGEGVTVKPRREVALSAPPPRAP